MFCAKTVVLRVFGPRILILAADTVQLNGSSFASFSDVLSHSYQNGAYLVIQIDADTAVWLNGATAGTVTAANFSIVS